MPLANREAVIAIQGGGVWALSLLGQARAVLEAGYTPLAIAGTRRRNPCEPALVRADAP
jgi:predicted acylesterase/phospholipase RssA